MANVRPSDPFTNIFGNQTFFTGEYYSYDCKCAHVCKRMVLPGFPEPCACCEGYSRILWCQEGIHDCCWLCLLSILKWTSLKALKKNELLDPSEYGVYWVNLHGEITNTETPRTVTNKNTKMHLELLSFKIQIPFRK